MEPDFQITTVDHRTLPVACQLHAVQMRAYAQEAQWLGAVHFPPLERTVAEVGASTETFLAAFVAGEIVGAVSVSPDDEDMGVNIASLVVDPPFQQRGIGRALVAAVVQAYEGKDLTVQTGVKNLPALSLYRQFGFVELRRWFVGPDPLELTKLRRGASSGSP